MHGFILEIIAGRTWKREGMTFWTQADATLEAQRIMRRGKAVEVRILPVSIGEQAGDCLHAGECSRD